MTAQKASRFLVALFIPLTSLVGLVATTITASQPVIAEELQANDSAIGVEYGPPTKFGEANQQGSVDDSVAPFQDPTVLNNLVLLPSTSLTVSILTHPWATLDKNNPMGLGGEEVPRVFVVEAVVTNTGAFSATNVSVDLDYDRDGWQLLPGENASRHLDILEPNANVFVYWFATYTTTIDAGHAYTVTSSANNALPVSSAHNIYGDPVPGETVRTRGALNTGNAGLIQSDAEVVIGAPFTVSVAYDLGQNPLNLAVSPVGNLDFDAAAIRLLSTRMELYNDAGTQKQTVFDQLYIPSLPSFAENLTATFTLLSVAPSDTRVCPYVVVSTMTSKYDTGYCDGNSVITMTSSSIFSLTLAQTPKSPTIRQNEKITYTLRYTNSGNISLANVWIWDEYDLNLGSIITSSANPLGEPAQSSPSRIAWFFRLIPGHSSGTITFATLVDGNGQDLADQTALINRARYGIGPLAFPTTAVATATVTSTLQAPMLALDKTDGLAIINAGSLLTYSLRITNSGSIAATNLAITDTLPSGIQYVNGAGESSRIGQQLVWNSLGPLQPTASITITVPVTADVGLVNGSMLTNTMLVDHGNGAGHNYQLARAIDTTLVQAPTLVISKQALPEPVYAGSLLTYTLTYSNTGAGQATNVAISDTVPLNTVYQQCFGGSACSINNGVVTWNVGTLPASSSDDVSYVTIVSDTLANESQVTNDRYSIWSDQTGLVSGLTMSTTVLRAAGWFEGAAFVDNDGDGQKDAGESPLSGVTLTLPSATIPQTTTGPSGTYLFRVEIEQPVTISSMLPAGYFRTTPGTVTADSEYGITKTIDFGYAVSGSDFGVIHGIVYEDGNGNGILDSGDLGIPDVLVALDGTITRTTDLYGRYSFTTTVKGFHTVKETDPSDFFSTTPNEVQVDLALNTSHEVNFGDAQTSSGLSAIFGTVFNDKNGNGQRDLGELGLPNVLVTLDIRTTGNTNAYGNYTFVTDTVGIHHLVEEDPLGFFSTTPNEVHFQVEAGNDVQVDFGDAASTTSGFATLYGTVFQDDDRDSYWDSGEPGIANVTVRLDITETTTTDAFGNFTLVTQQGGSHQISQLDRPGFTSTTPNTVTLSTATGQGYLVNFGDTLLCGQDAYEEDDWPNLAKVLNLDTDQSRNFCDDTVDWLQLEAQVGAVYTITTSSWGKRADTYLALLDVDGQTILTANDDFEGSIDYSSRIVWAAEEVGTYYIRVTNRSGLSGINTEYDVQLRGTITPPPNHLYLPFVTTGSDPGRVRKQALESVTLQPTGLITHTCPDVYETDDHWQEAVELVTSIPQVHSFDSNPYLYAADKDFVWFDLPSNSTFTATISNPTNTSTLMELYDAFGNFLNVTGTSQLEWSTRPAGRYYLSVSPLKLAFGCANEVGYTLEAEIVINKYMLFLPAINGPDP